MQSKYSIKDLEHLSGVKAHTIRAWESRYKLIEPFRTSTNIRYYGDDHLKKLLNIAVLVKNGVRISKLVQLSDEEIHLAVLNSGRYESNFTTYVNALKMATLAYDAKEFDSVISRCIVSNGSRKAFDEVVGPFIQEIGLLWQIGAISVSHEHFASNMLRMKLFSLIEQSMSGQKVKNRESYILYLPAGELHELSLLYMYYNLVVMGSEVIYLGQSVPMDYLVEVSQKTGIRNFISVFTTNPNKEDVQGYFDKIVDIFPDAGCKFMFCGKQLELVSENISMPMISVFKGFQELQNSL